MAKRKQTSKKQPPRKLPTTRQARKEKEDEDAAVEAAVAEAAAMAAESEEQSETESETEADAKKKQKRVAQMQTAKQRHNEKIKKHQNDRMTKAQKVMKASVVEDFVPDEVAPLI